MGLVTRKIEHTFCDGCGKEITENPHSLISEGSEWDTCSGKCHFELEEKKYGAKSKMDLIRATVDPEDVDEAYANSVGW